MLCANCFSEIRTVKCPYCGYTLSDDIPDRAALPTGTVLNGRYVTGKIIGKGGFGIIYLAYDTRDEKTVAIKEYFPHGAAVREKDNKTVDVLASEQRAGFLTGTEKFYNEASLISELSECPEALSVFEVFRENGTAYYAMEYINGVSLKEYVEKSGVITAENAVYLAEKILPALKALHEQNIIHRDVSPDNIMLCSNGRIKLIDFGAARRYSENDDDNLSVILKPGYAPLEQYQRNGRQGSYTDIYSLGMSMIYGLTSISPDDPMTRLDDDSRLAAISENIPTEIRPVIKKSAALKSADRYADADEMLRALADSGVKGSAPSVGADSCPLPRTKVKIRRKKLWLAAVIAAVPIIAAAVVCAVLFGGNAQSDEPIAARALITDTAAAETDTPKEMKIGDTFYSLDSVKLELREMELTNAGIANLKHFKNLKELNISDNYITDLSVLSGLVNMEKLTFNNNVVADISFAQNMNKLINISGENNIVSDISPLGGKTQLENVFFGNNNVTDISPLSDCSLLIRIGFNEAQLANIDALANKRMLSMVCLSGCGITDISPLATCQNLKYVYLGRNKVSDLSPLSSCFAITELYLDNNPINDSLDTFAGINLYGYCTVDSNGITQEQADYLVSVINGKYTLEY